MSLSVTLNVFSGRPNPVWIVPEGAADDLNRRIAAITTTSNVKPPGVLGGLGYRGFSVRRNEESDATFIHEGVVDQGVNTPALVSGDHDLEQWLLSTAGDAVSAEVRAHVQSILNAPVSDAPIRFAPDAACPTPAAADAPAYNPAAWNTPAVQPHNNCYNYANNRITNTFAQPGRGSGHQLTQMQNCNGPGGPQPAAVSDGLAVAGGFSGHLGAGQGYYVALVVWPGSDFHWYRQDNVGCWSHKPGSTAVRNVDNAGRTISDPRTADRGPYTLFCTYMITKASVQIR